MKICLNILLIFFAQLCIAQSNSTLQKTWQNATLKDSVRLDALEKYYDHTNQAQPDSALQSLKYYLTLAQKTKNPQKLFEAHKRKGNILRLKGEIDLALEEYKKPK
ncbi:hypothetical protein [Frigoriflavimonas asaccharolytica]|uniref:Tetratricopeptide repeat protein n=1 Tax=Frigoriflavimonas asaccharolytica TaxID=2735899 RepID=A0A8J8K7I3_9FLAO|nr:hypothetical protein [Frigoriflavimonas asaccharolytica]NRS92043.1 hypothetical protein [Frigoriflavimonas asaccharolytica]